MYYVYQIQPPQCNRNERDEYVHIQTYICRYIYAIMHTRTQEKRKEKPLNFASVTNVWNQTYNSLTTIEMKLKYVPVI